MLLTQANSMSRLKMHHHYAAVDLIRMSDPSGEDVESTKKLRDNYVDTTYRVMDILRGVEN